MPRGRKSGTRRFRRRMKRKGRMGRETAARQEAPVSDLKALLASAPLDGIDLERRRDLGREIDL